MSKMIEYLVIGAGASGVFATNMLAKSGEKVTLVSKKIGGIYGEDGRVSFYLLNHVASMFENYRTVQDCFIEQEQEESTPDMKSIKKYIDTNTNRVNKAIESEIDDENINYINGSVSFVSENEVKIINSDGTEEICKFKKCLIATGAYSVKSPLLAGKKVLDICNITNQEAIPKSIIVLGGGITGIDVALLFSKFGSKVSVVEQNERILKSLDPLISKKYEDILKKRGITVYTNHTPSKIERIGQKYVLLFEDSKLESEELLVCIGRKPFIQELSLDLAGVSIDEDSNPIFSENLCTDNPNIFISGDATGIEMNVSWAYHSAHVAVFNMLGNEEEYDSIMYNHSVSADSNLISVGLSEDEAKAKGYNIGVLKYNGSDIFKHMYVSDASVFIKAIYNKDNKVFLGFQILGRDAGSYAAVCSYILQRQSTPETLNRYISSTPLLSEFFKEMLVKIK